MGKYSGMIGFATNVEKEPSIYDDVITEQKYYGDILENNSKFIVSDNLSGDVQITNQFSIVGDSFAFQNYTDIRYLTWKGKRWIVTFVKEQYPRLVLTIGGIYNGQTPETGSDSETDSED